MLSNSYNCIVIESTLDIERQWEILMKEADDRAAQLSRNYERKLEEIKAKVSCLQSTCGHIMRQRQQEARSAREELQV